MDDEIVIALVGNPNVGKSTLFNVMTGSNQHTGNWPGKTVSVEQGKYSYKGKTYVLVDLPGTYSIEARSEEEEVTREFIQSDMADCMVIVADATCFERNLAFALQIMSMVPKVVLCVNLLDEAERHKISIDLKQLHSLLSIPVVGVSAGRGEGIQELKETIRNTADGFAVQPSVEYYDGVRKEKKFYASKAREICKKCVKGERAPKLHWFDRIAMGKRSGSVLLIGLLFLIFWLTIMGSNYPSMWLENLFYYFEILLRRITRQLPQWLTGLSIDGVYCTTAKVIAVMLPPLLIFFPLFTLLEDFGYLTRAAFISDHLFERCGSCGKQLMTISMGFGCNAVGVMGCRIFSSKSQRLTAMLTNSFVPCNGRFPALITLCYLFFANWSYMPALVLVAVVLIGVVVTFVITKILNILLPRDDCADFVIEIPPYRRPSLKKIISYAIMNKALYVMLRAAAVAAPAGAVIWCLQQITIGDMTVMQYVAQHLDPIGRFLGMNGAIILAFILSFPANELLLPILITILNSSSASIETLLLANGWTWKTALCTIIFILFHWPCSTTCLTIRKETGSWKWMIISILTPLMVGCIICIVLNQCLN